MKPFFDVVPVFVVEMTARLVPSRSSQIAAGIDEKRCLGHIVFLSESVEERRRGTDSAAAVDVHLQEQLRLEVDGGVDPLLLTVNLDLFLIDRDPDGSAVGGSLWASASDSFQFQVT